MSSETQETQSGSQNTYTGRCKWFNNRLGYGFITVDNSTPHYSTVHDTTLHYNTIHNNTIRYNTIHYSTIQ